jgi:hypothetical protein
VNVRGKDLALAQNFKIVEWLKAELVDAVSDLFKSLLKAGSETKNDALASIVIITYLLGQRIGVSFAHLDHTIKEKLHTSIKDTQEIHLWYSDLSDLSYYLENKKR